MLEAFDPRIPATGLELTTWEATSELRWLGRENRFESHIIHEIVLQQRWRSNKGGERWEDVPTVET